MKLYTEEQVRKAHQNGRHGGHNETWYDTDDYIKSLTPIELPSDEEIEKQFTIGVTPQTSYPHMIDGAKWIRDKIQGGNK